MADVQRVRVTYEAAQIDVLRAILAELGAIRALLEPRQTGVTYLIEGSDAAQVAAAIREHG